MKGFRQKVKHMVHRDSDTRNNNYGMPISTMPVDPMTQGTLANNQGGLVGSPVMMKQQPVMNSQGVMNSGAPVIAPGAVPIASPVAQQGLGSNGTTVETFVRPAIVEETQQFQKVVEVQPIIHRIIDAPTIQIIEKHIYETVPSTGPTVITKPPIVQEIVRPRIIQEIHPIVHQSVPAPVVEQVQEHVNERVVRPPVVVQQPAIVQNQLNSNGLNTNWQNQQLNGPLNTAIPNQQFNGPLNTNQQLPLSPSLNQQPILPVQNQQTLNNIQNDHLPNPLDPPGTTPRARAMPPTL